MECKHIKDDGTRCGQPAMRNDDHCFWHSKNISEKKKEEVRKKGGKVVKILSQESLEPIKIEDTVDVVLLLADTINRARAGKMDTRVANCVGLLSGQILRAFEISDVEKRLNKIEELLLSREVS